MSSKEAITLPRPEHELEETLGYRFDNPAYLTIALTHSSFSNEMRAKHIECEHNERMEFLGDAVLSFITADYLFKKFPDLPEGDLSRIRSGTVCEKALYRFACEIGLGDYLRLGHGEERLGGRNKPSVLSDAFEAMLAALYLDGGIEVTRTFLMPYLVDEIDQIIETGNVRDYKTLLQQIIQQERGEHPTYVPVDAEGPAHKRTFTVEARLNSNVIGKGTGSSKRQAEQAAAKEALALFGVDPD